MMKKILTFFVKQSGRTGDIMRVLQFKNKELIEKYFYEYVLIVPAKSLVIAGFSITVEIEIIYINKKLSDVKKQIEKKVSLSEKQRWELNGVIYSKIEELDEKYEGGCDKLDNKIEEPIQ